MKKISLCLVALLIIGCSITILAQDQSKKTEVKKEKDNFTFGNVSPVILEQGKFEVTTISSLSSFWFTNAYGNQTIDRYRISRLDNLLNINYGISYDKRIDIGLQARYGVIRIDDNARSSPFKLFSNDQTTGINTSGLSTIGGRIRVQPFSSPKFTVVNTFSIPVHADKNVRKILNADRPQNDFIATYYTPISTSDYLFIQGRYTVQIANADNTNSTHFPGISSFYVKSLIHYKWYVYPGISYVGSFNQAVRGGHLGNSGQYVFAALGSQFQFSESLGIFAYTQYPLYYKSSIDFYSRLIRNSYSDISLGLRVTF